MGNSDGDEQQEAHGRAGASPAGARGPLFTGVGTVCETAARLSGVDGAAVAVFAPSRSRELLYATDAMAQQLDDLQFILGEGPCLEAYHTGVPQMCPDVDAADQLDRWPAFFGGAADLGVRAVFAFPVLAAKGVLGVLELYRLSTGDMKFGQRESAAVCARAIADTLLTNWASHLAGAIDAMAAIEAASTDPESGIDGGSQFSRARVYIASGMVAVQLGISADEGLDRLRAHTYAASRSITDVAADIISKRLSLREFRDDGKDGRGP